MGVSTAYSNPQIPGNGTCPSLRTIAIAMSLVKGLQFYQNNNGQDKVDFKARFQQKLLFLGKKQKGRVLVKTVKNKKTLGSVTCGWVNEKFLLVGDTPLLVRELGGTVPLKTKNGQNIKNPLYVKTLIRSNPSVTRSDKDNYDALQVDLFQRPDTSSVKIQTGIFGIFRAYKSYRNGDQTWYFISGQDPYVSQKETGWVREENIFLWESQIALYYSEASEGAGIIVHPSDQLSGKLGDRPPNFKEPKERNFPRYAVLDNFPSKNGGTVFNIAFFGQEACFFDKTCKSSGDYLSGVSKASEFVIKSNQIDVLFVIDNTASMGKYFKYILNAVQNATSKISSTAELSDGNRDRQRRQLRYAVAIYGDQTSSDAYDIEYKMFNFGRAGSVRSIQGLKDYYNTIGKFPDSYKKDIPEAGFAAISKAISDARWRPLPSSRVVFWIGDHNSRTRFGTLNTDTISKELNKVQALFYPINVRGDLETKSIDSNRKFIEQGNEILGKIGSERSVVKSYTSESTRDYSQAQERIETGITQVFLQAKLLERDFGANNNFEKIQKTDAFKHIPKSVVNLLVEERLRIAGYTREEIRRIKKAGQLMVPGYIHYPKNGKGLKFWVALDSKKLNLLSDFLSRTCRAFIGSSPGRRIRSAITQMVQVYGGDEYNPEESINDFLTRRLYLPKKYLSNLLNRTVKEIENDWLEISQNIEQANRYRGPICKSAKLIEWVQQDKQPVDIDKLEANEFMRDWKGKTKKFKWYWERENGAKYYYIPARYFPGTPES